MPVTLLPETKRCAKCREVLPAERFQVVRRQTRPDALMSRCIDCAREYARSRTKRPPTKEQNRRYRLKTVYGISTEQYDEMFEAQGGVCAICAQPPESTRTLRRLAVDHTAEVGVRGLLCYRCNLALGDISTSTRALRAFVYLARSEKREDNE